MISKFDKQLKEWNHGTLRGAQAKLAKTLKVSTATTALWATGKRHPSKGYIEQMAALFKLDIYGVLKLFDNISGTSYPLPNAKNNKALHEPTLNYSDNLIENTVKLPFLSNVPADFSQYPEENILEWWSIPRRYAQGAKYIVRSQDIGLPDAVCESDLSFIKPCSKITAAHWVVLTDKQGAFCVAKSNYKNGKIQYQIKTPKFKNKKSNWQPIGILLKRIKPF